MYQSISNKELTTNLLIIIRKYEGINNSTPRYLKKIKSANYYRHTITYYYIYQYHYILITTTDYLLLPIIYHKLKTIFFSLLRIPQIPTTPLSESSQSPPLYRVKG